MTHLVSVLAAESESTGIGVLGIKPLAILLQLTTFVILFLLLKKFAFDKIVAVLEKRRQTIEDGIRLGKEMEDEYARSEAKKEEMLQKARSQADGIIAGAKDEGAAIVKAAEDAAAAKSQRMLADADAKLNQDTDAARESLKKELLGLVSEATENVVNQKLDPKTDNKLVQQSIDKAAKQ